MSKNPYVLPLEYKQLAIDNGLKVQTVYKRIQKGWDLYRACTQKARKPPSHLYTARRVEGMIQSERPRSKKITFNYYDDDASRLDKAIEESGLSASEFSAKAMEEYLDKLWKPKIARKIKK